MPLFHLVILALVQGITEFLPVSSSGHLVIAHALLDDGHSAAEELTLDIAVHVGTLFAVLLYFRRDIGAMLARLPALAKAGGEGAGPEGRLFAHIMLASLPVIAAGLVLHFWMPEWLRSLKVLAFTTILFGILLWWADRRPAGRALPDMTWKQALLIGLAQVLALVPGTSRSGITMTAARWLGFGRVEAARFSLFLAIIAISGAGVLGGMDLWRGQNLTLTANALLAVFISFVAGWIAIALMLRWLEKATFTPFAVYRVLLGLLLLAFAFANGS